MGCMYASAFATHPYVSEQKLGFRYEVYGTLTMWPQEVRGDLREALKAKEKPDLTTSAAYLQR